VANRVAVMYRGRFVEVGPSAEVFARPQHPYTQVLFSAAPPPHPGGTALRHRAYGEPPHTGARPVGCVFASRCPLVLDACRSDTPASAGSLRTMRLRAFGSTTIRTRCLHRSPRPHDGGRFFGRHG
jgi:oligopeptide/dipeptide ABC transporter ATP-binding protein